MNQLTILPNTEAACPKCGDALERIFGIPGPIEFICPNCETEKERMEEFDELIEADEGVSVAWDNFHARARRRIMEGAKRLSAMPLLYEMRQGTGLECSNAHAPMLARKFNAVSGHPFFKCKRLKRKGL